ncbi:MAG: 16S rRNA (cytidine(1402)-2'-O)-methyltransferase [Pseudomonadota bacterium]
MNYQRVPLPAGIYFVGVPIGTARDITLRALDVLASAEVLAAEDSRSLRKLMDIHGIPLSGRRIKVLHDHSKKAQSDALLLAAQSGQSVAYASEAGMPLIADPGFELARAAHAAGVPLTCAPGPSAVLTALTIAGLPTDAFHFAGFAPPASAARQRALQALAETRATLAFYEAPQRLAAFLADAAKVLGGERDAVVCRELTKKFEEIRRGSLSQLAEHYARAQVKGEIVVLIDRAGSETVKDVDIEKVLQAALATMSVRDAAEMVAKAHDLPRRQVYQTALKLGKAFE